MSGDGSYSMMCYFAGGGVIYGALKLPKSEIEEEIN